jgi:hypothetical protein
MLIFFLFTAISLLVAIIWVIFRALDYIQQHPELVTAGEPLAYQRCHATLYAIILRYKQIKQRSPTRAFFGWAAPNGRVYRVSSGGVEEQRSSVRYHLRWSDIGGVGLRMQPGFRLADEDRDGWVDSRYTTGYSFHLLIVPLSGDTIEVQIPVNGRDDAVDFVAFTIIFAEQERKRVNIFGFDKPPTPYRQRTSRI